MDKYLKDNTLLEDQNLILSTHAHNHLKLQFQ